MSAVGAINGSVSQFCMGIDVSCIGFWASLIITREPPLERCPNLALALAFFGPGTREAFSPGWRHQPGLNASLVPGAKNAEANAKLRHRSKVCSLVVISHQPENIIS